FILSGRGARDMTRETKAGLVVTFSFLCLVSVVLFLKLNPAEGAGPTGADDADKVALAGDLEPKQVTPEASAAATGESGTQPAPTAAAGQTAAGQSGQSGAAATGQTTAGAPGLF